MNPEVKKWSKLLLQIVLWVLFWYFLAPYYLLKKFVFGKTTHKVLWSSLATIAIFIGLGIATMPKSNDQETTHTASKEKVEYVTKKKGSERLSAAEDKEKSLNKEKKKKKAEYAKLVAALEAAEDKEEKEQEEQEEKEQQEKEAQEERARQEKEAQKKQAQQSAAQEAQTSNNTGNSGNSNGIGHRDMNTADTQTIVGNRKSKIYHVPGQAGYRMNSANAVYFSSESEAQAAGYRKALR